MLSFCELLGEKEFKQLARIEIHRDFGSETKRDDDIQLNWVFKQKTTSFYWYIYKTVESQLGLSGSSGFRVDQVCRAKSLAGFFFNPARFQAKVDTSGRAEF